MTTNIPTFTNPVIEGVPYVLNRKPRTKLHEILFKLDIYKVFFEAEDNKSDGKIICPQLFQGAYLVEAGKYSRRENKELRQRIAALPNVGPTGLEITTNIDVITDEKSPDKVKTVERTRSYKHVPLSLFIWFPSLIIASHEKRDNLFARYQIGSTIPRVLTEFSNKIRNTSIPGVITTVSGTVLHNIPGIKDTYYDPQYLVKEENFSKYMDIVTDICISEGGYIEYEILTDINRSKLLPQLYGGHQCTFCAIQTQQEIEYTTKYWNIQVRPINSYPKDKSLLGLQAMDACIAGNTLYTKDENGTPEEVKFISELKQDFLELSSTIPIVNYIFNRVCVLPAVDDDGSTKGSNPNPKGKAKDSGRDANPKDNWKEQREDRKNTLKEGSNKGSTKGSSSKDKDTKGSATPTGTPPASQDNNSKFIEDAYKALINSNKFKDIIYEIMSRGTLPGYSLAT